MHNISRLICIIVAILVVPALTLAEPAAAKFSNALPNVTTDQLSVEMGKPITLNLQLEKGWILNPEAPNFLAMFAGKKNLWQVDKTQLLKNNKQTLPGITKPVHLQGTFYYCRTDHQSQCLIKSIDYTLAPGNFDNNTLTVWLKP
jgi:hypothetical protein